MKKFAWYRLLFAFLVPLLGTQMVASQPLFDPFVFQMPTYDSSFGAWLPTATLERAGDHGFLTANSVGHFQFSDGAPVRFIGATISGAACFPDSLGAIATARRLRKLGINIVRFDYFDYSSNDAASTLAPGIHSDSLSRSQMSKLDWFLHVLKLNGI